MLINKLSEECYLFFPKGDDIRIGKGAKCARFIFDGTTEFDEFENNHIKNFKEFIKQSVANESPDLYKKIQLLTDSHLLRFILATGCDYKETHGALEGNIKFMEKAKSVQLDDEILSFLKSGQIYMFGRDRNFRPIVVFNVTKFNIEDGEFDAEKQVRVFTCFFEYLVNNLLLPGQIENWITIIDLKDISIWNIPYKKLGNLMKFAQSSYRSRLFRCYILNAPYSVSIPWSFAKKTMAAVSIAKVSIQRSNCCDKMWEHISKSQIEEKFGGTHPNIEPSELWPPKVSSYNFMLPTDKPNERLINKKTYYDKYINGLLDPRIISMEIIDKFKPRQILENKEGLESIDNFENVDENITIINMRLYTTAMKGPNSEKYCIPKTTEKIIDPFSKFLDSSFYNVDEYYTKQEKTKFLKEVKRTLNNFSLLGK